MLSGSDRDSAPESPERKLAAILSADVAGYSALMGRNEAATVQTLSEHRAVVRACVERYSGKIDDAKGDAILAEFANAVNAVSCAVEIQRQLDEHNASLPEERRMRLRIGVNLGDVIVKDDTVYGDGVNIAARLEALAEPGGICISRMVYDNVKGKLPLRFESLGRKAMKNIAEPVEVFRVSTSGAMAGGAKNTGWRRAFTARRGALGLIASVLVAGTVFAIWQTMRSPSNPDQPQDETALKLPDQPSIAVLPFVNMSGDPEQEYFADGVADDIITRLSNLRNLFVVARNSAFAYKGKSPDIRQVGRDLGVRYVLEGSVRKAGEQLRITAQLIDASTGEHVWAQSFDRRIQDFFAVQDEITQKIVTELEVNLLAGEKARLWRRSTNSLPAYEAFLRARHHTEQVSRGDSEQADFWFSKALERDPKFAVAYAWLAMKYVIDYRYGWGGSSAEVLNRAQIAAQNAVNLDSELAIARSHLGYVWFIKGDDERANREFEKALATSANDADVGAIVGMAFYWQGRLEEAERLLARAIRQSPYPPSWYPMFLGDTYRLEGRHDQAIPWLRKALKLAPKYAGARIRLICAYAALGQQNQAAQELEVLLRDNPGFTLEKFKTEWALKATSFRNPAEIDRMANLLSQAGLK